MSEDTSSPAAPTIRAYKGREHIKSVAAVLIHLARAVPGSVIEFYRDFLACSIGRLETNDWRQPPVTALAAELCKLRVLNSLQRVGTTRLPPLKPEIEYESRLLLGTVHAATGIAYDVHGLQRLVERLSLSKQDTSETVDIWFTSRPLVMWDEEGGLYRPCLRVFGRPSIISVGSIEQVLSLATRDEEPRPEEREHGTPLKSDPRVADAMVAYAMQSVSLSFGGRLPPENPRCDVSSAAQLPPRTRETTPASVTHPTPERNWRLVRRRP